MRNYLFRGLNSKDIKNGRFIPYGYANLYSMVLNTDPFTRYTINYRSSKAEAMRHQFLNHGLIFKDMIEKMGLNWDDISQAIIKNGWAKWISSREIMLNVNLNYDKNDKKAEEKAKKLEERMRKAVGMNFQKILPILKRATCTAGIPTSKSFDIAVKFATKNGTKDGKVAIISREKLSQYQIEEFDAELFGSPQKQADREVILYAGNGGFYFPKEIIVKEKEVKASEYKPQITISDFGACPIRSSKNSWQINLGTLSL